MRAPRAAATASSSATAISRSSSATAARTEERAFMGQKVNPVGIRLGITRDWTSTWYANKRNFPVYVYQDWQVRSFLKKKLAEASVSRINIERAARKANITIHTARPGVVIGKKGEDIERLRQEVAKMMKMGVNDVRL